MWNDFKHILINLTGFGPATLHIVFAILIFAMVVAVFRRPRLAFFVVAAAQLVNEVLDAWFDLASGRGFRFADAVEDTAITLAAAGLAWLVVACARRVLRT